MALFTEVFHPLSLVVEYFSRYDEDVVDRLNHKFSTFGFCALSVFAICQQFVGDTIRCWAPAEFTDPWIEYTNQVCWISNTYYIPMAEHNILAAPRKMITYYQWVPLVFLLQACMFYLPYVNWYVLSKSVGIDINKIAENIRQIEHINPDIRDKCTKYMAKHIDRLLKSTQPVHDGVCASIKSSLAEVGLCCGKRYGNFLIVVYLITKFLYFSSAMLQLYMLNIFLGTEYTFYGVEILRDLSMSGEYQESKSFPRVTLCDFVIRTFAKNQPYTVQCVLPINIFNEKIFIFVWFWLVFMVLANISSIIYWIWIIFTTNRRRFIKTFLKSFSTYDDDDHRYVLREFCDEYLRQDGYFLMRMVGKNTNQVVIGELISNLWSVFRKRRERQQAQEV